MAPIKTPEIFTSERRVERECRKRKGRVSISRTVQARRGEGERAVCGVAEAESSWCRRPGLIVSVLVQTVRDSSVMRRGRG